MSRLFNRTSKASFAIFGVLLMGGAIAFAKHSPVLARVLAGPTKAVALEASQSAMQQVANRPLVKIVLVGSIKRDTKQIPLEKAGPVSPGEIVNFTISSVNEGSAPARQYRAVGQIPRGSTYIAGSAQSDHTQVNYSIDGGQQFSSRPMIEEKQADGTTKKVAAPVSMYTQVRFEWADPLAAGGALVASYQVRVK